MGRYNVFIEVILLLLYQPRLLAVPVLSLCSSPVKNQNCILQCRESSVISPVTFEHPSGVVQGSCLIPGVNSVCNSANYIVYQSLPITYFKIASLDRNRDEGNWKCRHGTSSSETLTLYVSSPLRTQEKPQVTITETEIKITCAMLCQYPTTTINVELLYAEEGTSNYTPFPSSPNITIDSTDSSGCESYESNYKANFTFTKSDDLNTVLGKRITSKCNFTQSIIQTSEDTGTASVSFVFNFKASTTTSPTSTQTIPLQERHDIVCGTSGISAVVPHSLFPGNPTVTWSDPSCSVQSNGSHFVASIGFHDCGTTVRFTTDTVIFENTLKSNGATTMNPVVDFGESSVYTIPIQCVYQRKENVTGSFFPIRQTTRYFEKRFGHLDLHMEKYTDDKFTRTLTNQRIPLGSDFFVKLTVDHLNRSDLAIKADNCVATPTSSPADSLFFRLLQDGCPSSSAVHLIQSAYNEVRFRMTSFIFRGTGTGLVYIHCEVSVCPASSTECSVGCLNRRKRAASNVHSSHLLSAGPILLVTDEGTPASVIVAAVCAAVAVVATVFAVIGWRRRRDFGKTDILH